MLSRSGRAGLVVVGAGIAGLRVAQGVRREGYDGPVTLIGAEPHLPYDRPPLSKQVLTGGLATAAAQYHDAAYFDEMGVSVRTSVRVRHLDVSSRTVTVEAADSRSPGSSQPERIDFGALVVATGARPRRLPCATPPVGVHVVRTIEDAAALASALQAAQRVVVVGAGFVGAEVASSARTLGAEVTIIEAAPSPMMRAIGPVAAELLSGLHQLNGVNLRCGIGVTGMLGDDRVRGVILDDGSAIPADLVVIGVGVVPDIEWLKSSGLPLGDGLECDEFLQARTEVVLGVGDAVSWPNEAMNGTRVRSQQWTTAGDQGFHAARVLVHGPDSAGPFGHDMYFWSDQYGVKIQGAGEYSGDVDIVEKRPDLTRIIAAYRHGGLIQGALTVNSPKQFRRLRRQIGREDGVAVTVGADAPSCATGESQHQSRVPHPYPEPATSNERSQS